MNFSPRIYPISNYTFGTRKETQEDLQTQEEDEQGAVDETSGIVKTVEALILVHIHYHPFALLLKPNKNYFALPGGRIDPGESDEAGLKRKLETTFFGPHEQTDFVLTRLSVWYRAELDQPFFPFRPPHIEVPKETKAIYFVQIPEHMAFAIPPKNTLVAVPFFDLYDNGATYGPLISSLPQIAARFDFTFYDGPEAPHSKDYEIAIEELREKKRAKEERSQNTEQQIALIKTENEEISEKSEEVKDGEILNDQEKDRIVNNHREEPHDQIREEKIQGKDQNEREIATNLPQTERLQEATKKDQEKVTETTQAMKTIKQEVREATEQDQNAKEQSNNESVSDATTESITQEQNIQIKMEK